MGHSVALNFADGKTFFISVNDDELLLDAAVRQGINLPLDCREGVCGTCQGQCETGIYEQDYVDEDALSERDLAERKMLACQTRVMSNAAFYLTITQISVMQVTRSSLPPRSLLLSWFLKQLQFYTLMPAYIRNSYSFCQDNMHAYRFQAHQTGALILLPTGQITLTSYSF